jgi:hypothetical protein
MDFNCDLIFRSHHVHELIIETNCLKTMVIPALVLSKKIILHFILKNHILAFLCLTHIGFLHCTSKIYSSLSLGVHSEIYYAYVLT